MIKDEQKQSCHPELVSGSCKSVGEKILNRVQNDKVVDAGQLKVWIATLTTFARNDRKRAAFTLTEVPEARQHSCHPEFISGSKTEKMLKRYKENRKIFKILNRVQNDKNFSCEPVCVAVQHDNRRVAFTLAEVLITLGIIGVVAAMTIPTLIQKHEEKVTVTKVKKMYSTLSQAYLMNKAQDEIVLENTQSDGANAAKEVAAIFVPYLKIAKNCDTTQNECGYSGTYKHLKTTGVDTYIVGGSNPTYRVLLQDGSTVWFRRMNDYTSTIFYDTNGVKEPNTYGKDFFRFVIINDRVIPEGSVEYNRNDCVSANSAGRGCAAWVIQIGNMDYLHCNDLSWNGKHSCK